MALKWVLLFVLLDIRIQTADAEFRIEVFSVSSKSIIFQWDKVTGATSYEITVAPENNPSQPLAFATFGANTVMGSISTGLSPGTNYVYTIVAKNNSGAQLDTQSGQQLTAPSTMDPIISVKPKDSTSVVMQFVPKAGATKYVIRIQNSQGYFREVEVTSSPAEVTSLMPYTEYKLSIMAVNTGGRSQPTAALAVKTLLPAPQPQSSSPNNSTIEVSWVTVDQAVEYTVCLLKYNNSAIEKITLNTSSNSLTFLGLDAGALYLIDSYAWDTEGRKGEHSVETNQTTRPPTPGIVAVTMATTNYQMGLSVTWTMAPDVYGTIQYNVTSDQGQTCDTTSLSCELSPVACGTVYAVSVTAINTAGPSVPSDPIHFTTIPCPPENLAVEETSPGSCNFTWDAVLHAEGYRAFIKSNAGKEEICNTTVTSCNYSCECGHTYFMNVFAHNGAGSSQEGPHLNYTTLPCCPTLMNVSLVSTDTLEIEWVAARGADMYETRAADQSDIIHCNDTAPVCALSYLNCDTDYTVKVIPCNDNSGCNANCPTHTKRTAACMPTDLSLSPVNATTVTVSWTANNQAATFTVTATGDRSIQNCSTSLTSCDLNDLVCGSSYEVGVIATSDAGESLPSFTVLYETEPCCPSTLSVEQVTQSMTNVSWSQAKGAHTFLTSLTSPKGQARCHTEDSHCIMGCITCGTSYNVNMHVYSLSGLQSNCSYQGFSSSLCCPSGVKLYRTASNKLRVQWRSTPGSSHSTEVEMKGTNDYFCRAGPGESHCDISGVQCGDEYVVVVAPVKDDGNTVEFCAHRKYAVSCSGGSLGSVYFRGKRSVE